MTRYARARVIFLLTTLNLLYAVSWHNAPASVSAFVPDRDMTLSGQVTYSRVEIPSGVTITVSSDLVLECDDEIVISGSLLGGMNLYTPTASGMGFSSSPGVSITLRAKNRVVVNGEIQAGAGGFGGLGGGNVTIDAPLVIGVGEIRGGDGGRAVAGGRGGDGGSVRVIGISYSTSADVSLQFIGGTGGAGGLALLENQDGGTGGDGGSVIASPMTDGTPGDPGADDNGANFLCLCFPPTPSCTNGSNGAPGGVAIGGAGGDGGNGTGYGRGGDGGRGGNAVGGQAGCGCSGGICGTVGNPGGDGGVGGSATGGNGGNGGNAGPSSGCPDRSGAAGGDGGAGGNATGGNGGKGGNGGSGSIAQGPGGDGGNGGSATAGSGGNGGNGGNGTTGGLRGSRGLAGSAAAGSGGAAGAGGSSGAPGNPGATTSGSNGLFGTDGFSTCAPLAGVVVESKTVPINATGVEVGIYINNNFDVQVIALPLEIYSITSGSFIASAPVLDVPLSGRIGSTSLSGSRFPQTRPNPDGTCESGPVTHSFGTLGPADLVSPDGVAWFAFAFDDEDDLIAGVDPAGSPSLTLTFDVTGVAGSFVIDTCCMNPANHCEFYGEGSPAASVVPTFVKGTITVVACACDCHGDPACDGVRCDVLDVVNTINTAFRGTASVDDPNPLCPHEPTDVNCSNSTDVLDVVKLINVAFRGGLVETEFCDPCP